jgi:hypothetical protein
MILGINKELTDWSSVRRRNALSLGYVLRFSSILREDLQKSAPFNIAMFGCLPSHLSAHNNSNSVALVRKRTIMKERPPLVSEVSANILLIENAAWSVQRIPTAVNLDFMDPEPLLFHSFSSSVILTKLSGPLSRPTTSERIWYGRE